MSNIDAINQAPLGIPHAPSASTLIRQRPNPWFNVLAAVVVVAGIIYTGIHLADDLSVVRYTQAYPYILLGIALLIALGFEFVNGFHDTANAVATVIYTNSMSPNLAVVWSGLFNFAGVMISTGAVAFGIVSLLPVELILQVGSGAGFAMVFALLIAAILWNLGTWYFGLPSSSSHTLIGSIIGVGLMNQLMAASPSGTSGVDWSQATKIGYTLLFSPLIGLSAAFLLLTILKAIIRIPALSHYGAGGPPADPHATALNIVRAREVTAPGVAALSALAESISYQVNQYHSMDKVPAGSMVNIRNDMYLVSEGLRFMGKAKGLGVSEADKRTLDAYQKQLDHSTKFIPTWVKVAVAIALGLGTMIGWKRIVVTVGERIGKTHLTYAQGASAEIVAMATIGAAELYGLPASTTHVLSSGVAGTMVANHSGLQWSTVRSLLMAWVLTLPVSIALAGSLYWLLRQFM